MHGWVYQTKALLLIQVEVFSFISDAKIFKYAKNVLLYYIILLCSSGVNGATTSYMYYIIHLF